MPDIFSTCPRSSKTSSKGCDVRRLSNTRHYTTKIQRCRQLNFIIAFLLGTISMGLNICECVCIQKIHGLTHWFYLICVCVCVLCVNQIIINEETKYSWKWFVLSVENKSTYYRITTAAILHFFERNFKEFDEHEKLHKIWRYFWVSSRISKRPPRVFP